MKIFVDRQIVSDFGAKKMKIFVDRQVVPCHRLIAGSNPTIVSYNASVVKTYNATNSMAHFRIKIICPHLKMH
jgi:hypothetical protein